jgi:arylsulfatase
MIRRTVAIMVAAAAILVASGAVAQEKPNIVLVFMDNFGWGEPGFNGALRRRGSTRSLPRGCG